MKMPKGFRYERRADTTAHDQDIDPWGLPPINMRVPQLAGAHPLTSG